MNFEIVKVPYTGKNRCKSCNGKKFIRYLEVAEYDEYKMTRKCDACDGTGREKIAKDEWILYVKKETPT